MTFDVMIGDQPVKMTALASTDRYYALIFGKDPIVEQAAADFGAGELISLMERMAFVMAKQAELEPAAMTRLTPIAYLEWLDNFERLDLMKAIVQIRMLYEGQKKPTSISKKKDDR